MRQADPTQGFRWEIRRLSAIVVERSRQNFMTADLARADGEAALRTLVTDRPITAPS